MSTVLIGKSFVDPIASGGPEPMFLEYKSRGDPVMNNMIQGIVMGEGIGSRFGCYCRCRT